MKSSKLYLASLAILALTSCQGLFYNGADRDIVQFSASAGRDALTKASYSGIKSGNKERITWDNGDAVSVHMWWKSPAGSTEGENPIHTLPYTISYPVSDHADQGDRSYGRLRVANTDTPFRWKGDADHEYTHYFYSVYPPLAEKDFDPNGPDGADPRIYFELPSDQGDGSINNMAYAYMAAAAPPVTTRSDNNYTKTVDLDYYPMVTTLYVKITNNAEKTLSKLTLKSESVPLAGSYEAYLGPRADAAAGARAFTVNDTGSAGAKTVSISATNETAAEGVALFIRPKSYSANDIEIFGTFGNEEKSLGKLRREINPFCKYNVQITINEDGDVDIIEDAALAQFILSLLVSKGGAGDCWKVFESYFREYFKYNSADELNKGIWQDVPSNGMTLSNHARNATLANSLEVLNNLFPGEKLTGLIKFLQSLPEIYIDNGYPKLSSSTLDLSFFKSAQKIEIYADGQETIKINGLTQLKSVTVTGSNGTRTLIIEECGELTTVTISEWNQNDAHVLTIDKCPKLTTVNKNDNNSKQIITITNCNDGVNTK